MEIPVSFHFDLMVQAQRAYDRALEPVFRQWGLTRSELDVILFLYNNPGYDRAVDIVTRRGMAKSHVSLSVSTLEEKGLLAREFSETDRRTAHLKLLPPALTIAQQGRQAQHGFFALLHQGVSPEELEVQKRISGKVLENLSNME